MDEMMYVKDVAELWGITERQVTSLCRDGKIDGAYKDGKRWLIPEDADKPDDNRIKTGVYCKDKLIERLPLPIGVSDYSLASSEYYYVDKTMMIKDFIDERPMVALFTRPRRFGKTLNMDMLRTYFEISDRDTSVLFRDKKIWNCGQKYRDFQGKYPVIFLSFKDVKFETWNETFATLRKIIAREVQRHEEIKHMMRDNAYDMALYESMAGNQSDEAQLVSSLGDLSYLLHKYYNTAPIIIIDEYDTPVQQGYVKGFYDEIIGFMRNFFSNGFKDNHNLSFGFLTGILRVTKESIFSGMNNLAIYSVLDSKYSKYFGFTSEEVKQMAKYYGAADRFHEIVQWYNGYKFGNIDIFNPWSVVNYFSNECEPRAYWVSTGSNDVIGEVLAKADAEIYDKLTSLIKGGTFVSLIDTGVIYPEIKENPSTIYSFLIVTGYLKVLEKKLSVNGDYMCEVALPNKEIAQVYNREILRKLEPMITPSTAIAIQEAVFTGNQLRLKEEVEKLLKQSVSFFDTANENFYHGFMLGLCALMGDAFVTSNRESGEGRYDIQLRPKDERLPGVLIELKAAKKCGDEELKALARNALRQINDKKYDKELETAGIGNIYKYGVAFCGKNVEVVVS